MVDECVFLSGPPLATVLATTVDPAAGLVAAIVAGLVGTLVFCALRGTEPPAAPGATPMASRSRCRGGGCSRSR